MNDDTLKSNIRRMECADIPTGMRLCAQAGWNQTESDWERLLAWEPDGCFVLESASGPVSATVTTTVYGERLAWVGMMLVDAACRRQGMARTLLTHALTYLDQTRGVPTVALDATPLGRPLYESMGFVDLFGLKRYEGIAPPVERPPDVLPLSVNNLPELAALDAAAFGADRLRILRSFIVDEAIRCYWLHSHTNGPALGFVWVRPGTRAWYVGPLVAHDASTAEMLLRAVLATLPGEQIAIDIPDTNQEAERLVASFGFSAVRPFVRMARGGPMPPTEPDICYAIAGPEIG